MKKVKEYKKNLRCKIISNKYYFIQNNFHWTSSISQAA